MAYSKQAFNKASEIIEKRRRDALDECEMRHSKCVILYPEIQQLEQEMSKAALDAPKAIGMKDGSKEYIEKLKKINLSCQERIGEILRENNLPEDYLKPRFYCKKCEDTGFVNCIMCDCLKECMKNVAISETSEKLPIKDCTFDKFDLKYYPKETDEFAKCVPYDQMTNVLKFCKAYADDFKKHSDSMIFTGQTGLGKTHISLAIAGKVIEKGFNVVYNSAQNLFNMLEDEKFGRSDRERNIELMILNCDLLIIDDLGSEFCTQFTLSALYNVINSRLLERKPVIISTNLTPEEMDSKYSGRITSRIYGNYRHILFLGKDIRQLKNKY